MEVDDIDTILKSFGAGHSWASVAEGAGLSDYSKVCQAISSFYNRLVKDYSDKNAAKKLLDYVSKHSLIFPDEDYLCALHEVAIGEMYEALQVDSIVVGDQYDRTGRLSLANFLDPDRSIQDIPKSPLVSYSHDDDLQILTVSDYNKQYTLVCLSQEANKVVDPSIGLEGFWADAETDAGWWVKV